ncbi:MAG: SAM-dependent methyltransferase, partial [Lachnospiraceae bacterium]|nr:SAM-dependent methyltransferase [Lachnospiraceae bacterium]
IGLDLKEDVIERCSALAEKCGYERLKFMTGDIADYEADAQEGRPAADMVITLHACDTATDYALAKAVGWNAGVILSVPCCQHELNAQIRNDLLEPVLKYGLLKERMAALITDGLRASLLETQGYEVHVLEFIDMEHTPKNILIRAVRRGKQIDPARIARGRAEKAGKTRAESSAVDSAADAAGSISADDRRQEKIQELEKAIGADLTLERLLRQISAE